MQSGILWRWCRLVLFTKCLCITIQSQPCVHACRLTPMCIIEGMLCNVCFTLHSHNHMHGEPTWSSVAGNTSHTPEHSLRADSAHLHRTMSPSASDTAEEAQSQWRKDVHTINVYTYLIHPKNYKLVVVNRCDLLRPAMFNPESMIFFLLTSVQRQLLQSLNPWYKVSSPYIGLHDIIHGYI